MLTEFRGRAGLSLGVFLALFAARSRAGLRGGRFCARQGGKKEKRGAWGKTEFLYV